MDHRPRVAAPVQACHFDVLNGLFSFVRVRSGVNVPSTLLNRADEVIE